MHVIILAAGNSKRFRDEGYTIPKPFLEVEWQGLVAPMLEHVIYTVPLEFPNVMVAIPPEYKCSRGWFPIEKTTGPADTTRQMIEILEPDSCLVMDSDILNFTNDLRGITNLPDDHCGVLVCRSANPAFSYVDSLEYFSHIKEKNRISEYAVRGAYFVGKEAMGEFTMALVSVIESQSEPYISHAFDLMGCKKIAIETTYVPTDWGTPHDVQLSGARIITERRKENVRN